MPDVESLPSTPRERQDIVFSPGGSVHALDFNSPNGLYGTAKDLTQSEFGADRTYGGESYAELYAAHQREAPLPPSALRRSTSMARTEDTPGGKLRRKVSFHVTTNDFTSRVSLRSVVSGASVLDLDVVDAAPAAPADPRAASCITHMLAFMGGSRAGPGCCEPRPPEDADETVERMRRSLSSQLAFSQQQEQGGTR